MAHDSSASTPAAVRSTWPRPQRVLLLVLSYLALVVLRLALSWPVSCPVKGDEVVYLGTARGLATGTGLVLSDGRHAYKIGYSLLLVPAMLVDHTPLGGFRGAQVTNAFLLALVLPLGFVLARRLDPALGDDECWLVAVGAALYPAALLYSTTAMSAAAFVPAFFVVVLGALAALRSSTWLAWLGCGAATGFLYSIHERALGVVLVVSAAALLALALRSRRRWQAAGFFVGLAVVSGLVRLLDVPGTTWHTGTTGARVLRRALTDPHTLLATTTGHLWYLGLATFGTVFVGLLVLLLGWRRQRLPASLRDPGVAVMVASAASVVATSIAFNVARWDVQRLTHWIYGRQSESVLLPVLILALVAIRAAGRSGQRRELVASYVMAALALLSLTLSLRALWTPDVGGPYSFGVSSAPLYLALLGLGRIPAVLALGLGFAMLGWLLATRWRWGIVALAMLFVISTTITYRDSWVERSQEVAGERELAQLVRRLEAGPVAPPAEILYPRELATFNFHFYNAAYYLPEYPFRSLGVDVTQPSGQLVLSGRLDPGTLWPGTRLVGLESLPTRGVGYIQSLAVTPGPLQDELGRRGWLVPAGFPAALPRQAVAASLAVEGAPAPSHLRPGESAPLRLALTNRGRCPWPHRRGLGSKQWAVRLLTSWQPAAAARPATMSWADLPRMVYPGETVVLETGLRAATGERPLPPGDYRVSLTIAQYDRGRPVVAASPALELAVTLPAGGD